MTTAMLILLIDTSHPQAHLALVREEAIIAQRDWPNDKQTGTKLLAAVDESLREHKISLKDIERIAVHVGPGGYSSLRAGAVVAQMMSLAAGAELVEVAGENVQEMIEQALAAAPVKIPTLKYAPSGIG